MVYYESGIQGGKPSSFFQTYSYSVGWKDTDCICVLDHLTFQKLRQFNLGQALHFQENVQKTI